MNARASTLWLLLCLASCGSGDPAPWQGPPDLPLDLRVELMAAEVPLLGEVELHVDLYRAAGVEVDFAPEVPEGFRGTVQAGAPKPLGEGSRRRWSLLLRPVKGPGELKIPAFAATSRDGTATATTPELTLQVVSTLDEGASKAVEEPAPPFPTPVDWESAAWIGGIAAAVVAALVILLRRRRERAPAAAVPLPPHVKALRELARLRQAPRTTPHQVEQFYVDVSRVLRVYLEERFGFHSPEQTTEEFLVDAETSDLLSDEQRQALRRFLGQCDLVKFADQHPDEAVHDETFAFAERFVEATRPDRRTAPTEPAPAALASEEAVR